MYNLRFCFYATLCTANHGANLTASLPTTADSLIQSPATPDSLPKKRGLIKKVIDYFRDSNKPKPQNKVDLAYCPALTTHRPPGSASALSAQHLHHRRCRQHIGTLERLGLHRHDHRWLLHGGATRHAPFSKRKIPLRLQT